jgi:hypothetical protein
MAAAAVSLAFSAPASVLTIALAVIAVAGEPVTFVTREGGMFPNGQAVVTVRCQADGVARTRFTATPGTVDDVTVIAGSPATSGTAEIILHVSYPGSQLTGEPVSATPSQSATISIP